MEVNLINCPVCTFLNNPSNTNCDCCDSLLNPDSVAENNPLEDEFMKLTGESRSVATEYLGVTFNNLDKAVGLFFEDKERGVSNADYRNSVMDMFMSVLQSAMRREYQNPENVRDLTCQILYTRGRNNPHECEQCDSKAFLLSAKILSYESSFMNIIRMIPQEDLEHLKIESNEYENLAKDIISKIKETFLPKIITNLTNYISNAYFNRDELRKTYEMEYVEEYMDSRNGLEFRIIWDTLHQSESKLEKDKIDESLKLLVNSTEFHSYLNQSWESPIYNHPATKEAIQKLTKIKLIEKSDDYNDLKNKKCSICMEEFKPDGREVIRLKCHSFCSECILEWLENHNNNCPVCRKPVTEEPEKNHKEQVKNEEVYK